MATHRLLLPDDARAVTARRYANQRRRWLRGEGEWPMALGLGLPGEAVARRQPDALRAWVMAWEAWRGPGAVRWHQRRWPNLGIQKFPKQLILSGPEEAAACAGAREEWARAVERHGRLVTRWPALEGFADAHFRTLADYSSEEFDRLLAVLTWFESHRDSGLYPRQLPVPEVDSKWLERHKQVLTSLAPRLWGREGGTDLCGNLGLRPLPSTIRGRLLDPELRACAGGLEDIAAPPGDWAALNLPARQVLIVENLQTGLAFPDLPGTVVFMGLGYAVDLLKEIPWVGSRPCHYWGDLDTHGLAILGHLRGVLPETESLLMDQVTLLAHRALWVEETKQHGAAALPGLTAAEQDLYEGLATHRWGPSVRLEQERIPWPEALRAVCQRLGVTSHPST